MSPQTAVKYTPPATAVKHTPPGTTETVTRLPVSRPASPSLNQLDFEEPIEEVADFHEITFSNNQTHPELIENAELNMLIHEYDHAN